MMKDLSVSLLFIMFLGLSLFVPADSFSANFSRVIESEYQQYMESSADFNMIRDDGYAIPDNCGIVKSSFLIDDDLYQITLDNGEGVLRTFYYYHQKNNYDTKCGDFVGMICFEVLQEVPVTKKMRENGIQGDRMTLIHQCNVPS